MNRISIGQAWAYGTSFFSGQVANHAIALIGVGVLVPLVLQFALGGGLAAASDPMALAGGSGPVAILLSLIGYILQTGSYFASWRLGLSNGEPLGSAIAYGLVAALPVLALSILIVFVIGLVGFLVFGGLFASLTMGSPDPGSLARGGMMMLLLAPLFFLLVIWLAARLCCAGPIMADRRSYNVVSALGDSWRMTAVSQWKLVGYFVLLAIALLVVFTIVGAIVGVSMFAGGGMPSSGSIVGLIVGSLLLTVPRAFLQVGIPAGIYRALGNSNQADVFA